MNTVWIYTLELASVIANLYYNNPKYNNVRVFIPSYGKNYADNFQDRILTDLQNTNPKSVAPIFIDASHIELEEKAMQPRIVLHYAPKSDTTDVHLVAIDHANYKIDRIRIEKMTAADAGEYYYNLSNDTQEYYEQIIKG
ncbi:hypothetical protein HN014_03980 [Aquimarina sp. TRL1]|uniref:hypothetical protein n=1 Tax=Aquimarina sp. (strain TRL1) TaxID=2736252 RepID=UPI001589D6BB|nr:hypothetical protein [Aquimarina sp. TRL1]QKX04101.1 hypothetical protein HN014_03980 [Aquimarina sp. TRL1]